MLRSFTRLAAAAALTCSLFVVSVPASAQSTYSCDVYARNYANQSTDGGEVLGGAIGGAVTGALLGGIFGGKRGAGQGAAIGTGVGAFGGAASSSRKWQDAYNYAFDYCMNESAGGPPPGPAAYADEAPEPWSAEWYDYCAAKYRSFDAHSGRYRTYSGQYKVCE